MFPTSKRLAVTLAAVGAIAAVTVAADGPVVDKLRGVTVTHEAGHLRGVTGTPTDPDPA